MQKNHIMIAIIVSLFPLIVWATDLCVENEPAPHILVNSPTHTNRTKHTDIKKKIAGKFYPKERKSL